MPPPRFNFRALPLAVPQTAAPVETNDESDELGALINGDFSTVAQVHPKLRFQAIGACPVPLRSSVMRVVFFKLLATGVFAALVAAGSSDPIVVKTCGLAAAINAVAVVHYSFIWKIRLQALNVKPLSAWMVGLGRDTAPGSGGYDAQAYQNSSKLYAQEIAVDSLRHSDWTVTLVLMKLVEHAIAGQAQPHTDNRIFATHVAAFLQTFVIFLGSIARFFLNDLRVPKDRARASRGVSVFLGTVAYLGATAIWVLTTLDLLLHVGPPHEKTTDNAMEDAYVLWTLSILQIGYPIISLLQVVWLNCWSRDLKPGNRGQPMPADQTDPLLSVLKDLGYGILDSVCKGGLALFVALRASR